MKIKSIVAVPLGVAWGIALLTFAAILVQPNVASAHDGEDHSKDEAKVVTTGVEKDEAYSYVAQTGDSYSELARKAVQTYGIVNKVTLSGAQIVFAETNLTKEAGSPVLNLNQEVTISIATVKSWVEKAQKLTDVQKTNWNYYVQFVDFNTNSVGESR